jgi:AcrR family transcriptional regulator
MPKKIQTLRSKNTNRRISSRVPRRRQKDRNAETRLKLVDAAARAIFKLGYGRASIGEIVKEAALSKGAHLHHFQTKEQLMAATIEHLFGEVRLRQERVAVRKPSTVEVIEARFEEAAETAFDWRFIALLEIWMASRTEPLLHKAFVAFEARHAAARRRWIEETFGDEAQLTPEFLDILGGMNFLLRGLFLQQILGGDWRINSTWRYWRHTVAKMLAENMARQQPLKRPAARPSASVN